MELPMAHPRRAFARRIVELEVRLAYYDRIKGTLPVELQEGALVAEEPNPFFTYESPGVCFLNLREVCSLLPILILSSPSLFS